MRVSTDAACFPPQIFSIIQEEEASFSRTLLKGIERYKKAASAARAGAPPAHFCAAQAAAVHNIQLSVHECLHTDHVLQNPAPLVAQTINRLHQPKMCTR